MNESTMNSKLIKSLKGGDMNVYKMPGTVFSSAYPDIAGTYKSIAFHIEGKRARWSANGKRLIYKRELTDNQFKKINELSDNGGALCFVAAYVEDETGKLQSLVLMASNQYFPRKQTEWLHVFDYRKQMFPEMGEWFRKLIIGFIIAHFGPQL